MLPTIVNRPAILEVISDIVSTYVDAVDPPFVAWDTGAVGIGDGRDYGRNASGGGCVILSVRNITEIGSTRDSFEPAGPDEGTVHTVVRGFTLSIKVESDVLEERDLAFDIAETIRSRAYWQAWRLRFASAGLSVLRTLSLTCATSDWSGRTMSYATLDIDCLTAVAELDDDPDSKYFATSTLITGVGNG